MKTGFFKRDDLINDPGAAGSFEQDVGADNVGFNEDSRIQDRAVHMRFSRKVDDRVDLMLTKKLIQQVAIGDVSVHKQVALRMGEIFEVLQAAGVGKRVEVDDLYVRVLQQQVVDEVGADEARASGYQLVFHYYSLNLPRADQPAGNTSASARVGASLSLIERVGSFPATKSHSIPIAGSFQRMPRSHSGA